MPANDRSNSPTAIVMTTPRPRKTTGVIWLNTVRIALIGLTSPGTNASSTSSMTIHSSTRA